MIRRLRVSFVLVLTLSALLIPLAAQRGAGTGEWRSYNGDAGSTKYAPLDQINKDNVSRVQLLWRRPAVDASLTKRDPKLRFSNNFRASPLMVGGVLYSPNGVGLAEAFHPGTGRTLWVQEPFEGDTLTGDSTRGVAYWTDGKDARILVQRGEYLYALNATTGRVYPDFGERGRVDLNLGLGPLMRDFRWTGAPLVIRDVVLIGGSMTDSPSQQRAAARRCARVRRPHRQNPLAVPRHPASRGVRRRNVGRRLVEVQRTGAGLVAIQRGRGARLRLHAGHLADERHVRWTPAGPQPVRAKPRVRARRYRRTHLALPAHTPRSLGLRSARRADPRRHHGRRTADQRGRSAHEAVVRVRVRPRHRHARVADRRAASAAVVDAGRDRRARRSHSRRGRRRTIARARRSTT